MDWVKVKASCLALAGKEGPVMEWIISVQDWQVYILHNNSGRNWVSAPDKKWFWFSWILWRGLSEKQVPTEIDSFEIIWDSASKSVSKYKIGDTYSGPKLEPLEGGKKSSALWLKEWDLFVALKGNPYFPEWKIVALCHDDDSNCPQFASSDSNKDKWYCDLTYFAKLPKEAEKKTILEKIFKKKPKHTYNKYYKRDDGVVFHKDTIDWTPIAELEEKEQEYYTKARAIRAKINAHSKLTF